MNKNNVAVMIGAMLGGAAMVTQAAVLNPGDILTIDASVVDHELGVTGGSWYAMDMTGDGQISPNERGPLYPGTDGGIIMGMTQAPGEIDYYLLGGNPGYDYTTVAPTGGTDTGIVFSGWTIAWNENPAIPMVSGAWTPSNCSVLGCTGASFANGVAAFSWSGVYGDSYSLWYTVTVPLGPPNVFGSVRYMLHLEGAVIASVPAPAALWLLGSGILALGVSARRGRATGRSHPSLHKARERECML